MFPSGPIKSSFLIVSTRGVEAAAVMQHIVLMIRINAINQRLWIQKNPHSTNYKLNN